MRNASIVIGVVLLVLVLLLAGGIGMMGLNRFGLGPWMMGGHGGSGMMNGYGFSPVGGILSVIFLGLIIGGIALVAVRLARGDGQWGIHTGSSESPFQILKTRYAKGEITKEQFESIKRDLGE